MIVFWLWQVWDRRRRIPSQTYNDALDHIFNEFDIDSDGHLTAVEIAQALQSRGVDASADVVQEFIDGKQCMPSCCKHGCLIDDTMWCTVPAAWLLTQCRAQHELTVDTLCHDVALCPNRTPLLFEPCEGLKCMYN